jgi:hypothetical protein
MGLLDTSLTSAITGIKNTVSSHLPNISNLTKDTTKLDTFKTVGNSSTASDPTIGNYTYPEDLTQAAHMPHWVTFFINVRGKSKIAQQNPDQLFTGTPVVMAGENRLDPATMDDAVIAQGRAGGAVAALGAGKKVGTYAAKVAFRRAVGSGSGAKVSGLSAAVAGIAAGGAVVGAGAVAGGLLATLTVKPDTTYRIKDAITLYVPQSPVFHSGAQYDTVDFGALGGFAAGGASYADTLDKSQQNQEALLAAARAMMKGPAKFLTGGGAAMIEATTKQTLNPYREVLFKQIDFRKFSFDYRFLPKSQNETNVVQKIIKTFRYHMHPERSSGGMYYIHPSEFNIQYYFKGKDNDYVNKISTCVLVDMDVQYGPAEGFSTFNDGAPTEISMRLTFQELETLSKERIEAGY